mmetsp:Transcript_15880/g.18327  ORF Transcript_15880/g.18327 Transcript_15880/m.18327 type:complete len:380 (+) Transcript_15880:106-1245(+)
MSTTTHPANDQQERQRDLASLPKAELHLHLEGSMRRRTMEELCEKYDIPIPMDTAQQRFKDFSAFVDVYIAACNCLREPADVKRLVLEVVEDAKESGAAWVEIAPSFTFYADQFGGMFQTLKLLVDSAEEAELKTGVSIGLVISVERQLGVVEAKKLAFLTKLAVRGDGGGGGGKEALMICGRPAVIGFGLHGPEEGNPPSQFANAFDIACSVSDDNDDNDDNGINYRIASLPHAGEIAPSIGQGAQSVIDAVKILKAKRIGHGVLAYGDEDAMRLLADSNVCLDVCVSSNYLLNVVPTIESHPLVKLLERDIPCSINSDDPLLFGCTLLGEYNVCRQDLCMDDSMLAKCARYSFQYSCAPEDIKTKNLLNIDRWLCSS